MAKSATNNPRRDADHGGGWWAGRHAATSRAAQEEPKPAITCQAPAAARRANAAWGRRGPGAGPRARPARRQRPFETRPRRERIRCSPRGCRAYGRMRPYRKDVLAVILGGGRGTRLFPLTLHRRKPAVPIAGKVPCLIDIPISNCLNSDLRRNLRAHSTTPKPQQATQPTYKFDHFTAGFVSSCRGATGIAQSGSRARPTRTPEPAPLEAAGPYREVCILSGDQLYNMDLRRMRGAHAATWPDITVAVTRSCRRSRHRRSAS